MFTIYLRMRRGFLCRLSLLSTHEQRFSAGHLVCEFLDTQCASGWPERSPKRTEMFQRQSSHHRVYLIAALLLQRVDLQSCAHVRSCGGGGHGVRAAQRLVSASQLPRQTIEQRRDSRFLGLGVVQVKYRASPSSWLGLLYFRRSKR